jgi:DNA-binding FadR family transcriptional regulator
MPQIIATKSKAEQVAQQLLDRIIDAGLTPGSSFGTEADLLATFGVSRPTLRESLRILESQGILELRPGPGGGIMVKKPSTDVLAHTLSVYLRFHEVPFISALKAREVIETALAAEAAVNGTDTDFADMAASIERMRGLTDQDEIFEENRTFHGLIARASSNVVLETFWSTISTLAFGGHLGVRYTVSNVQAVVDAHSAILKAIRSRNVKAATEHMNAHVGDLEKLVRKRYKHLLGEPMSVVARQSRRAPPVKSQASKSSAQKAPPGKTKVKIAVVK